MILKKLAYIFFILLISILHSIALTFWLSDDTNLVEDDGVKMNNHKDSLLNSKRSDVITASEFSKLHQ